MRTSDVLQAFNGDRDAIATAVGVTASAVYQWDEIVPPASAILLREARPDIPYDPEVYRGWTANKRKSKRKSKRRH